MIQGPDRRKGTFHPQAISSILFQTAPLESISEGSVSEAFLEPFLVFCAIALGICLQDKSERLLGFS